MSASKKHTSFLLSDSPVKSPAWNAVISAALWTIVGINVFTLIKAHEILQANVIF